MKELRHFCLRFPKIKDFYPFLNLIFYFNFEKKKENFLLELFNTSQKKKIINYLLFKLYFKIIKKKKKNN
jgi:hypothetical protein